MHGRRVRVASLYRRFCELAQPFEQDPRLTAMKQIRHHGRASVFDHSRHVAWWSYRIQARLPGKKDVSSMMKIAFLHDYFLYDRKSKDGRRYHGYRHPVIAAENADRDFDISNKVYMAIVTHMWPEVIWSVPTSKEAWILCLADKICAVQEYIGRRHWAKRYAGL